MPFGAFGTIITFEVSSDRVLTPEELTVEGAARYAQHDVIGMPPIYEYIGPGLSTCTMTIKLREQQGVSPRDQALALRQAMHNGTAAALTLGGRAIFGVKSLAVIDSISENWTTFGKGGSPSGVDITVAWHEIVPRTLATVATPAATVPKAGVTKVRK